MRGLTASEPRSRGGHPPLVARPVPRPLAAAWRSAVDAPAPGLGRPADGLERRADPGRGRFAAALELLAALFPRWRRKGGYPGWAAALQAWSGALRPAVAQRLRREMRGFADKHWRRGGRCAFAADGSRVECPRTAANEEALGRAGRKKTGPQLFLTTLWHMGLGVPWDFRIGLGTEGERRHLRTCSAVARRRPGRGRRRIQRLRPARRLLGAAAVPVAGRVQRPPAGAAGPAPSGRH